MAVTNPDPDEYRTRLSPTERDPLYAAVPLSHRLFNELVEASFGLCDKTMLVLLKRPGTNAHQTTSHDESCANEGLNETAGRYYQLIRLRTI